jgi:YVTN family beta-propeller protein
VHVTPPCHRDLVAGDRRVTDNAWVEFRILGPLEVWKDGRRVELGVGKQRALLAVLLLRANQVVSTDELIDALWGANPPPTAHKALQGGVSQIRRALGSAAVLTRPPGYSLSVDRDSLDADSFERLLADGRRLAHDDPARGAELLRGALALWRGPVLPEFAFEEFARNEIARLEELKLTALEERIDADLELGRHADVVPELELAVNRNPLRERLRAQLMVALYRSNRQAEALAVYQQGRRLLAEELGLQPAPQLQDLERAILSQDPSLELQSGHCPSERRSGRSSRRRVLVWGLVGVTAAIAALVAVIGLTHGGTSSTAGTVTPDSVVQIDARTNDIVAVRSVGTDPIFLASLGPWIFTINAPDRTLSRLARAEPVRTLGASTKSPFGLLASPQGTLWIGSYDTGEITEVEPSSLLILRRIRFPDSGVTPAAVGRRFLWVTDGAIYQLRLSTGRPAHRFSIGAAGAVALYNGRAYATSVDGLVRIDGSVVEHLARIASPSDVDVGFGSVWVSSFSTSRVYRVNPFTGVVENVIQVGDGPLFLAVGAGAVWVTNEHSGTISRIDPRTDKVTATIRTGHHPKGIAVAGHFVWAAVSSVRF